jgi:hypothetical protein
MAREPFDVTPGEYDEDKDWYLMEYQEVSKHYLSLRDFRAKLLGFLPIASSGVFLLLAHKDEIKHLWLLKPIGAYGLTVTLGLFVYEKGVMQQLHDLIRRGAALEAGAKAKNGMFTCRENRLKWFVNPFFRSQVATAVIYGATLVGWCIVIYYGCTLK